MIAMKLFSAAVLFIIGDVLAAEPASKSTNAMAPVSIKMFSTTIDPDAVCTPSGTWADYVTRFEQEGKTNACGSKEKPCLASVTNYKKTFCMEGCIFKAELTYRKKASEPLKYPIHFKVYKQVLDAAVEDLPDANHPDWPTEEHKNDIAIEIEHGGFVEMCEKVCIVTLATIPDEGDKNVGTYCVRLADECTAKGLGIEGTATYDYEPIVNGVAEWDLGDCYGASPTVNCPATIRGYNGKAIYPAKITSEDACGGYSQSVEYTKQSTSLVCPSKKPISPFIDNCGYLSKPDEQPCFTNIVIAEKDFPEADKENDSKSVCSSCVELAYLLPDCKDATDLACHLKAPFHARIFDRIEPSDGDWFSYQPGNTAINRALQFNCPHVCDKTDENENADDRPWYCAKNKKKECDETVEDMKCCHEGYKHIHAIDKDNTPLLKFTTDKELNFAGAEFRIVKVADSCVKNIDAADVSISNLLVPALVMVIVNSLF